MFAFDFVLIGITAVLALRFLRPIEEETRDERPDYVGAALLATSILLAILFLQQGGVWGWTSPAVLGSLIASIALAVWFWVVEHRAAAPLVHFQLFRDHGYLGGVVTTFAQGFGRPCHPTWPARQRA